MNDFCPAGFLRWFLCLALLLLTSAIRAQTAMADGAAAWFPDSKRLLYIVNPGKEATLLEYDLRSGKARKIDLGPIPHPSSIAIARDGKHLAVVVSPDPASIRSDIYLMDADGSHLRKLLSVPNLVPGLVFSSNGDSVVLVEARVVTNYSPIASPHPHEMDLAYLSLDSGIQHWLTEEHAYQMSDPVIDPSDGSILVKKPGPVKDPNWGIPADALIKFQWNGAKLGDPQELRPDLSGYLEHTPWVEKYRNFYPYKDIYSPSFDGQGRLYFTWPTTNPESGKYDYEVYRWDPKTGHTARLTDLHALIDSLSPSLDGKWLALSIEKWSIFGRSYLTPYLYSIEDRDLRSLPERE
jgi:Tol biopolymer transport system component